MGKKRSRSPPSPRKRNASAKRAPAPVTTPPATPTSPLPSTSTGHSSSTTVASPFATPNPFSALPIEDNGSSKNQETNEKPPPIFINGVTDYMAFKLSMTQALEGQDFNCKSRVKDIIFNAATSDGYRKAVRHLKSMNADFHTYQLKEDRAYRVVIRNLHHSTPPEEIKKELEALGHSVRSVTNALSAVTKDKLPLFFVDLNQNESNDDIFKITRLLNTIIKVEEPHKKHVIPQCMRCQSYGHTKAYCHHQARCVKCAGLHVPSECSKSRELPAICALCRGSHPAN